MNTCSIEDINIKEIKGLLKIIFTKEPFVPFSDDFISSCAFILDFELNKKNLSKVIRRNLVMYRYNNADGPQQLLWAANTAREIAYDEKWAKKIELEAFKIFSQEIATIGLWAFGDADFSLLESMVYIADKYCLKQKDGMLRNAIAAYKKVIETGIDTDGNKASEEYLRDCHLCIEDIEEMLK